jgi:hypothetical protein
VQTFFQAIAPRSSHGTAFSVADQLSKARQEQGLGRKITAMNIKKKLLNPFVLIGQGFVAGAILFYSTAPEAPMSPPLPASASSAAVQQIAGI